MMSSKPCGVISPLQLIDADTAEGEYFENPFRDFFEICARVLEN
jgi:hypothetical protein